MKNIWGKNINFNLKAEDMQDKINGSMNLGSILGRVFHLVCFLFNIKEMMFACNYWRASFLNHPRENRKKIRFQCLEPHTSTYFISVMKEEKIPTRGVIKKFSAHKFSSYFNNVKFMPPWREYNFIVHSI